MNNLDDDLRETLRRHAPDPDSLRPLEWTPGPAHRAPTGPRRVLVPAFAAALVLVFLVAVGAFVVTRDPTSSAPVVPVGPSPSATPTPTITRSPSTLGGNSKATGTQDVHYRGVTLTVGRSLVLDAWECGEPVEETVMVGTAPKDCPDGVHGAIADAPIVKLLPSESAEGAALASKATTPVKVNGIDGFTDCRSCGDGTFEEGAHLYLPEQKVVVVAEAFGPGGYTNDVFRSVRPTDRAGCSLGVSPSADSSGAPDPTLGSAKITMARVCVYGTADRAGERVLLLNYTVSASTARTLAATFDGAPPVRPAAGEVDCVARWGPSDAVVTVHYAVVDALDPTVALRSFHVRHLAPSCAEVAQRATGLVSATGFGVEDLLDLRS